MRARRTLLIAGVAVGAATAGGFYLEEQAARDGARLFDQVLSYVEDRFVDSLGTAALFEKAAQGLVAQLDDPYSELLSPDETKRFNTTTGGRYGGVGMLIEDQYGSIVIQRVYPNTPAERAGIHEGDQIVEVDGQSTRGWKTSQVSERMQGEPGSTVRARFLRPGAPSPIDVTFTRATIRVPAVPYALLLDGKIGYIPLQTFNETASREIAAQIVRLQGEGATGLILDLRGNTGGFLEQALATANLFLKPGQEIVSVRSRGEATARARAEAQPVAPSIPVIVLTDGRSASASEIVAGALQDHDRGLVIGTTTFGKGLVQTMFTLDRGWSLKLTTGKWYTPSGRTIHKPRTTTELAAVAEDEAEHPGADRSKLPVFKSAGGRTIYGGGAIVPDIEVRPDTLTTAERTLAQKLLVKQQDVYIAIHTQALAVKDSVTPAFAVQGAWRDSLLARVREKGVEVERAEWEAGRPYVDRLLGNRVARFAFGDSIAKRRELPDDRPLNVALDILRRARSQQDVFAAAAVRKPTP